MNRMLLDCTLRDGGYVNDWEFGHDKITEIFERLVSAQIDIIEVGFLDERRKFDINRTIMPDTKSVNKVFEGLEKGNSLVVAMIDYGTCSIENIQPCEETFLDGIRVIFKEPLMYEALEFCRKLKNLGYKVFSQMVSVTTYTDERLKEYANLVNSVKPYANSMVDTYGLLHHRQLMHIFNVLDQNLSSDIIIGFHAHNNFQLGYANCIEYLETVVQRTIVADGTLYGMGKSAGNAPLELLAMYMNENFNTNYDICQILEAIENTIMDIYHKQCWGYNSFFYIAASTKCHPNYVSFLMDKKTLSVKQITNILNTITDDKRLMYDAKYAEKLYLEYQNIVCDDKEAIALLKAAFKGKRILLIGPGNNIKRQKNKVKKFVEENKPIVISVNYAPKDIKIDYVFLTKSKRYTQLLSDLKNSVNENSAIIATSNVTKTAGDFKYVLNYGSLIDKNTEIIDNSLVMLLKVMIEVKVGQVFLAGFDGYSKRNDNYFDVSREYSYAKEKASYLNKYVIDFLTNVNNKIYVDFITKSYYESF